jgi:hypothetical protein
MNKQMAEPQNDGDLSVLRISDLKEVEEEIAERVARKLSSRLLFREMTPNDQSNEQSIDQSHHYLGGKKPTKKIFDPLAGP